VPPIQYIVEGGHRIAGTIQPSGNKNAALPIIAAALLTDQPVVLDNVPRIRDTETLVELVRSVGASVEWQKPNRLVIHAKSIRAADLDPELCARIGNELRNQYLIGYAPTNGADDGRYRHVKVTVVPPPEMPPLRTHHRQGYYAGSSGQ